MSYLPFFVLAFIMLIFFPPFTFAAQATSGFVKAIPSDVYSLAIFSLVEYVIGKLPIKTNSTIETILYFGKKIFLRR